MVCITNAFVKHPDSTAALVTKMKQNFLFIDTSTAYQIDIVFVPVTRDVEFVYSKRLRSTLGGSRPGTRTLCFLGFVEKVHV
jgi:hypothetical protein